MESASMRLLKNVDFKPIEEKKKKEKEDDAFIKDSITAWDKLSDDLIEVHAAKMNKMLHDMTGSNFVKTYLQILEFAVPKITRKVGGSVKKKDNRIEVVIKKAV